MTAMGTMGLAPPLPPEASVELLDDEYVVHLGVNGFAREELEVEVVDRLVTVRGDQRRSGGGNMPFRLHEEFEDRFELPRDADPLGVTASYSDHELELHAPRTNGAAAHPHRVPIVQRFALNPDASGV